MDLQHLAYARLIRQKHRKKPRICNPWMLLGHMILVKTLILSKK